MPAPVLLLPAHFVSGRMNPWTGRVDLQTHTMASQRDCLLGTQTSSLQRRTEPGGQSLFCGSIMGSIVSKNTMHSTSRPL